MLSRCRGRDMAHLRLAPTRAGPNARLDDQHHPQDLSVPFRAGPSPLPRGSSPPPVPRLAPPMMLEVRVFSLRNSRKRTRTGVSAVAVFAALSLAACSSGDGGSDGAATGTPDGDSGDDVQLVLAIRSLSNPYHANWVEGAEIFAESVDKDLTVLSDDGDSQKQLSQIRSLIASGQTIALNVDPNTSSDTQAIVRAVTDAGGYVVTQWNKPDDLLPPDVGDNWVSHISFDGDESGYQIATALFEEMGGEGGIIALQGILDNVPAQQRFAGLQRALEEYPDIELLDDQTAQWDRNTGYSVTQTLLTKHGEDVQGIWAANDNMALGALEALKAAGRGGGEVPIVGVDAVPEALDEISSGENGYLATVTTDAWWQGGAPLALAYQAAIGEYDVADASDEQRAFYGTQFLVTQDNVDEHMSAPTAEELQPDLDDPFLRSVGPIE
ncbi:sugar ABC transporter substrate-binding protein [Ornithinimicrobium pratense]|uniref:Sugar ABC transporter substrate-binding protein n=1 Tax=Ornithinimicrobium pratense TaxID=2593973 RepID=A0A5J6V9C9_9MICO|nr:sugar ABC transporter substrate-binding protein [Ornithinimicrobium pratense]